MNAGASVATGDMLLFLHADTCLPTGYHTAMQEALEQQSRRLGRPSR